MNDAVVKYGSILNDSEKLPLCASFSNNDMKNALWAIDGNKAPGYNGFSSQFFKDSWEVVGDDF